MTGTGFIGLILIFANVLISYRGFTSEMFFARYEFEVEKVILYKDYKRLLTSGFLHVSWMHLIFNMFSLYAFSGLIEGSLGGIRFLIIYFASLIGGNLFSLVVHREHPDYVSVGASGAICGVMFASIALFPGVGMGLFFIPISIPSWIFGIAFIGFSIYGIRSNKRNIGHEAHLGGALIGMIVAILMVPSALINNYIIILVIAVPSIIFIYLVITRPYLLLVDNFYFKTHKDYYSIDHKYNEEKHNQQQEIDRILDKISKKGMSSLSKTEKETLKKYSRT
ncbi:MAG: rhomboid family intramembrane serine protease [Bacteroidetes bacterium]|nr:rhomboid family intramembrane serine protease [Bacteroidota bacterium]